MAGDSASESGGREPLEAATADLAEVRDVLRAAASGRADPAEVRESLQGYIDKHGAALRDAAASLTEEARRQTLEELYKWRAQLRAEQETRREDPPRHRAR